MSRRLAPLIAPMLAGVLAGCQPGSAGTLLPVPDPGVTIVTDSESGDTALVRQNGMEVRVSGHWTSMRGQSLEAIYSASPGNVPISLKPFALSRGREQMELIEINDVTRDAPNNPDYKVVTLYGSDGFGHEINMKSGPPAVSLEGRRLSVSFEDLEKPAELHEGDIVTAVIAAPGGPVRVRFRCD